MRDHSRAAACEGLRPVQPFLQCGEKDRPRLTTACCHRLGETPCQRRPLCCANSPLDGGGLQGQLDPAEANMHVARAETGRAWKRRPASGLRGSSMLAAGVKKAAASSPSFPASLPAPARPAAEPHLQLPKPLPAVACYVWSRPGKALHPHRRLLRPGWERCHPCQHALSQVSVLEFCCPVDLCRGPAACRRRCRAVRRIACLVSTDAGPVPRTPGALRATPRACWLRRPQERVRGRRAARRLMRRVCGGSARRGSPVQGQPGRQACAADPSGAPHCQRGAGVPAPRRQRGGRRRLRRRRRRRGRLRPQRSQ
jgi:hypothetical protein